MQHVRAGLITVGLGLASVGLGAMQAEAAAPFVSTFVVNTSVTGGPSPIVEATGVWTGCTGVIDLTGSGNQVSPTKLVFAGTKRVACPDGDVVVQYSAEYSMPSGYRTKGDFVILWSDNPGINGGAGTLRGDNRYCGDQCIMDTFSGRIY